MVLTDSCFAESMNEQVFTTITSASSAREVICAPPDCSMPIITSLSTRFLGQPKLTKPTFKGLGLWAGSCGQSATVGFSIGMLSLYCSIAIHQCFCGLNRFRELLSADHDPSITRPLQRLLIKS